MCTEPLYVICSDQYMMRRKRTEEEEKLLKLLQGMKPQDGFTTWCEQMLHALNTSANNSSSSLDGRLLSFDVFSNVKDGENEPYTWKADCYVLKMQHI